MKYLSKHVFLILLLAFIITNLKVNSQTKIKQNPNVIEEQKVIDNVMNLNEVKDISNYVDSVSKGKSKVFVMIQKYPTKKENYYWVRVAERLLNVKEPSFTPTIFHFYVSPKTYEIEYYDTALDKAIELSEWRLRNRNK